MVLFWAPLRIYLLRSVHSGQSADAPFSPFRRSASTGHAVGQRAQARLDFEAASRDPMLRASPTVSRTRKDNLAAYLRPSALKHLVSLPKLGKRKNRTNLGFEFPRFDKF